MNDFYALLALATALISLFIGIFSYYVGIRRGEKTYRYFAFMALCLAVFLILPPAGFILIDQAPYEVSLLGKRIFIFVYYALFPWYISSYTGFRNVLMTSLLSLWVIITYCLMFVADINDVLPVWIIFAVIGFVSIFIFGFVAAFQMFKTSETTRARWFLLAMSIFGLLLSVTISNIFFPDLGIFFPLHISAIPFLFIMGFQIVADFLKNRKVHQNR